MRGGTTEMTSSTRKRPGQRSDNEGKSKLSSGCRQTTKQRIEKEKKALISSDEENDDEEVGGGNTAVADASAGKKIISRRSRLKIRN
eukprot:scaffold33095_cov39-Attheya_sp.AAC.1